ncbi:MAG: helix-turn-helix transcriptional regulator [Bacteroidales bacterium]|nr:helix-turn-helix transcriptional regulator [Bacteroidales bacterium]
MALPDLPYNIALLSFFITIVLMLFFLITKKGRKTANFIMATLLLLFGVQIFYSFSVSDPVFTYFMGFHKPLFMLRQTAFLTGPLIYFYVLAFSKSIEFRASQLYHAIPFVGMLVYLIIHYSGSDNFIIWLSPLDLYTTICILVVILFYVLLSLNTLGLFKFSITEWFNNLKRSSHLSWVQYILLGFIIVWILNLNISAVWMITQKTDWCAYSRSIYTLAVFIFLVLVMFILMLYPAVYYLPEKYKKITVNEDVKGRYKLLLFDYMNSEKPYLNPDITLETVAKDTSINVRVLSQIINESYKNNFNGYINEYRIKESLKQLSYTENKKTILEIVYESGFNSKSAFYAEFKKHTGITPQEYRNQYIHQHMINAN